MRRLVRAGKISTRGRKMTAITVTQRRPRPPWALFFLLAAFVMGVVVTAHALASHKTEAWTSMRVLDQLQQYNRGQGGCQRIAIASCPNAANHIAGSEFYGRASPQFRVYCQQSPSYGIVGIFGMYPPNVYITGFALDAARWDQINARDACVMIADWWLGRILQ